MTSWELDNVRRRRRSVFITYTLPFKDGLGNDQRVLETARVDRIDEELEIAWMARIERRIAADLAEMNTVSAELVDGDITARFAKKD